MAECKGYLFVCSRCGVSVFTKTADYDQSKLPPDWHRCAMWYRDLTVCPECAAIAKEWGEAYIAETNKTRVGEIHYVEGAKK